MKLVCISDTHGLHREVNLPDGDVLIHAGDVSNAFKSRGGAMLPDFDSWLGALPYKHKIVIAGNHDWSFTTPKSHELLKNAIYLQDEAVEIEGVKFYGSPWQPWFGDWAFNLKRGPEIAEKWKLIPDDVDVLITHGPAAETLDLVGGVPVGCVDLKERIAELPNLKWHVFGHIHCAYGCTGKSVNSALVNEGYQLWNKPIVVEV